MDYAKTGQLIAQARREKGMTQRDLANRLHITDRAVSKWERGVSFPDVATLEPLSEALNLPLSQLITGTSDGTATEETLQESVQTFKKELKTKIRRAAWLTVVIMAGVAVLVIGICVLWRYVPAQRVSLREIPLTTGEREIAGTNGLSAARFRLHLSADVKKCQIIEETWTHEGMTDSQVLWDIPTEWTDHFDRYADRWSFTRKMVFTTGFSLKGQDQQYEWTCLTGGTLRRYSGEYPSDISTMWCQTYRDISKVHLEKEYAVPLMAAYLSDIVPDGFGLDGLQPGEAVSVVDGGVVKVLWLRVE